MKYSDVVRLHELGLITEEQRREIVATLKLKDEGGRLLLVLSTLGALLIVGGIVLLISANWGVIPRGVKIAAGLLLMLSAWGGGWYLREARGAYRKAGESLYLVGAGLWLANIALLGQIYHLSSRIPNAFLLWLAGIAATPWILRSKALFVLSLLAFGVWIGAEANSEAGLLGPNWYTAQAALYGWVGLLVLAWGYVLRRGRWDEFAPAAENSGLLALFLSTYPYCWRHFGGYGIEGNSAAALTLGGIALGAAILLAFGLSHRRLQLTAQWRWTWAATLVGLTGLLGVVLALGSTTERWRYGDQGISLALSWLMIGGAFVASLLQVQVGVFLRSRFMVNLAVTMLALLFLAAYVNLFGSMATTGWMFLLAGVFLVAFGIYLERKRRNLIARIRAGGPSMAES
jgi:uncharacterized membrane protein